MLNIREDAEEKQNEKSRSLNFEIMDVVIGEQQEGNRSLYRDHIDSEAS